jgi:RimJ/RimL family protein N-acetyltransferase
LTFVHAKRIEAADKRLLGAEGGGSIPGVNFPDDVPTLTDGDVTLRAHAAEDAVGVLEQCTDPVSRQWTTVPVPYSLELAHGFLTDVVPAGWSEGREWAFAVEAVDDTGVARFGGTVSLRNEGDGRAEIAYGAHPWVRGRGVMQQALELLLDWGFHKQGLDTVLWWANKGNWASRRLAWRLGFSLDGTVRRWLPQRGELLDAWVGGLLATDERRPRHPWLAVPRITGSRVVLREHQAQDTARVLDACSDERTAYWLGQMPQPYTLADAKAYVESRRELPATGRGVSWVVADPDTDQLLANISLFDLKPGREAEIGYWAHPAARGRGVTTEACGLVVRHAFVPEEDGGLGLRRLLIFAAEDNSASRRVIEANGFVATGRERGGTLLRDGTMVDTICYDLLAEEYVRPH